MAKRLIDSKIYSKPRFQKSALIDKYLIQYLFTCEESNCAGVYHMDLVDLSEHLGLETTELAEEALMRLQFNGFICFDPDRDLVYVKNLTVTNNYHMNNLESNKRAILGALRAAKGSPLVQSFYEDHKQLTGSKTFQEVFENLKKEQTIWD